MADKNGDDAVFLSIDNIPIYFKEDWQIGIGGGLWSTGLAIAKYFERHSVDVSNNLKRLDGIKRKRLNISGISAIELGSGNGLLSACLLALATSHNNIPLDNLVVTDLEDHLSLMENTMKVNSHVWDQLIVVKGGSSTTSHGNPSHRKENKVSVTIAEHIWGSSDEKKYDFIFGSDLAYRDSLHDPLISSLLQLSHQHTISLIGKFMLDALLSEHPNFRTNNIIIYYIGVTMNDTKPEFFDKLRKAGFRYERLGDNYMEGELRNGNFGIFVIMKR